MRPTAAGAGGGFDTPPAGRLESPPTEPTFSPAEPPSFPRKDGERVANSASSAADKLLQVLLAFEERSERALGDLAESLALPKSTVHRLLGSLKAYDLVEQDAHSGHYRLGLRAWTLAKHARPYERIRREARAELEELARASGETAFLTAPEGVHSVCIDRVEGGQTLRFSLEVGSASPLHRGASNLILLAFLPAARRDAALRHWLPAEGAPEGAPDRSPENADAARAELRAELQRIRRRGYAFTSAQLTPGVSALAVPVLDEKGGIAIGLSLGAPAERFDEARARRFVPLLTQAAQRLARRLDRSHPPVPRPHQPQPSK